MNKAKDFLQSLIREHDMPPKPTLDIDMSEFRTMQSLMILVQDEARAIRSLQEKVPKLKEQRSEAKGIFKGKERKALTEQIQQTEQEIDRRLDKLPDILKGDGYPDISLSTATAPTDSEWPCPSRISAQFSPASHLPTTTTRLKQALPAPAAFHIVPPASAPPTPAPA